MTLHAYKAMTVDGRVVVGRLEAINSTDLEMRLARMDLDLIVGSPCRHRAWRGSGHLSRRELINLCFHLEQLGRAGVPIADSLVDLRDSLETIRGREVIAGLIEGIGGGKSLSQAMGEQARIFDEVFVSMVRAGEESGRLPEVLQSLGSSLRWQDELVAQTKRLILYPSFLGVVVLAVFFFMMTYLVPKMVIFIQHMGQQIPLQTKILLATSDFIVHHWLLVLATPILAGLAVYEAARRSPQLRHRLDGIKLGLPLIGGILKKALLSRFATVFAMLYGAGIPILDALRSSGQVVNNHVLRQGLQQAASLIAEGHSVAGAFQQLPLFPPLVIRMLKIGEGTGALDTALANIAYFYGRDVKESIERGQAMIEPVMTLLVGLLLGWIILSVLGPIYDTIARLKI
ncbi:type II secretion system F family protein [Denitratisoma sp. agr-D3]